MTGAEADRSVSGNQLSGTVSGVVVQARDIDGPVIVNLAAVLSDRLACAADRLARKESAFWRGEQRRRRVHDPRPLRVRWREAPEALTDHRENIFAISAGSVPPLEVSGDLDQIAHAYRRIPSQRLVVLGRAGSGKTVLAVQLLLDLLATRSPDTRVPVLVGLGSWNPRIPLADWLASQLLRDHPWLAEVGTDLKTLGAELVRDGWLLPILDGFDEIADGLRPWALRVLAETDLPLVLTSRPKEYAAAVTGTRALHRAAVIELTDLALDEVRGYLRLASPKTVSHPVRTRWDPVLDQLAATPGNPAAGHLAQALTTPLMVAMARAVYGDAEDPDPAILLDAERFPTEEDLEYHLLGNLVPSVYRTRPGERPHGWNPEQAQRWLAFLAGHLDRLAVPDLAWWELGTALDRRLRTLIISVLTGLIFFGVTGVGNIPVDLVATSHGLAFAVRRALVVGALHGVVGGLAFGLMYGYATNRRVLKPSPVRVRLTSGTRQLGARLVTRLKIGIASGLLFGLVIVLADGPVAGWLGVDDGINTGGLLRSVLEFPPQVGLGIGLVFGVVTWLESPINVRDAVSTADLLTVNRTNVIVHMLVWAVVFGLGGALAASFTTGSLRSLEVGLVFALEAAFAGGLGYGLSLTAWGQWVALARIWLPLTRRLPWRLVAFLDDACQRGALRQAGAVYQFRHAQLQDHLVRTPPGGGQP